MAGLAARSLSPALPGAGIAVALLACLGAPSAAADRWSFDAGGALVGGYEAPGSSHFLSTGLGFLAVQRAVNPTLWARAEAAYFTYENGARWNPRRMDWGAVAAGFRWQPAPGLSGAALYIEFMPTLFVTRWREKYTWIAYQPFPGPYDTLTVRDRFTQLVPGFETGFGLAFRGNDRCHIHYGLRYQRSARLGRQWPPTPAATWREEFPGLSHWGFEVGLDWRR